ncbi:MAG: DUF3794 domain-containing protein [Clostridia bacterium]|nr:DUF3794 domain-containing protein [Clostridia bacterium]
MFIQDEKTNFLCEKAIKKTDSRDISAEYTLPDYLPDITRLLRVSAKAEHPEVYCSADAVDYDGKIIWGIVYATADGEIRCAVFDADYSGSVSAGDAEFSTAHVETSAENANCRLSGPRKLTLRCKLFAAMSIYPLRACEPAIAGKNAPDAEQKLQYQKKLLEFTKESRAEEKNTPVSEDMEIDPGMPPIERIVFVNLCPAAVEARISGGKITYSGALTAEVLYESTGEEGGRRYVSFSREVPVSGALETGGAAEDAFTLCDIEATNITYRPQTNELGETKTVELDFDYSVYFRIFEKNTCEITTDMYSLLYENTNEKVSFRYNVPEAHKIFNFSFGDSAECDEEGFENVVFASACASLGSTGKSGSKTAVSGTVAFNVILAGGEGAFVGKTFSFPFKAETDAGKYPELFSHVSNIHTSGASVRAVGGKIYCDCEITVCLALFGEKEAEALHASTIHTDRPVTPLSGADIVLYYPTRGETLWSVAKKYSTTEEKLAVANGGIKEAAEGGVLIIPAEKSGLIRKK